MAPVIEEVMKNIAEFLWVSRKDVNFVAENYQGQIKTDESSIASRRIWFPNK